MPLYALMGAMPTTQMAVATPCKALGEVSKQAARGVTALEGKQIVGALRHSRQQKWSEIGPNRRFIGRFRSEYESGNFRIGNKGLPPILFRRVCNEQRLWRGLPTGRVCLVAKEAHRHEQRAVRHDERYGEEGAIAEALGNGPTDNGCNQ